MALRFYCNTYLVLDQKRLQSRGQLSRVQEHNLLPLKGPGQPLQGSGSQGRVLDLSGLGGGGADGSLLGDH